MLIRRAEVADAERIAEVHVLAWQEGYRGQLPQRVLDDLDPAQRVARWRDTVERSDWPARGTLLAEDEGRLLGFADVRPTRDPGQDSSAGEVASFYVRPDAWGRGVGRALMQAAVASLSEAGFAVATLWVLSTNARAIAFYRALGWAPDGAVRRDTVGGATVLDRRYRRALI